MPCRTPREEKVGHVDARDQENKRYSDCQYQERQSYRSNEVVFPAYQLNAGQSWRLRSVLGFSPQLSPNRIRLGRCRR
jgi:hypothetical protein